MVAHRISPNFKTLSKWFSDEGLTRSASLNAIASTLDYGTRLVVGFAINPLLVTGLGSYGYGVTFSYPWIVGRYLGVSQSSQLKSIVRPALVTLLLFAFMAHLDSVVTAST